MGQWLNTDLLPLRPQFESRKRHCARIAFVHGSRPCFKRHFLGYFGFSLLINQYFLIPIRSHIFTALIQCKCVCVFNGPFCEFSAF